jgi:hypothetical protein
MSCALTIPDKLRTAQSRIANGNLTVLILDYLKGKSKEKNGEPAIRLARNSYLRVQFVYYY